MLGSKRLLAYLYSYGHPDCKFLSESRLPEQLDCRKLLAERQEYVIKEAVGLGGNGVHIGLNTDIKTWEQLVNKVAARPKSYVLQRYCNPVVTGTSSNIVFGQLLFSGRNGGVLMRYNDSSESKVVNSKGGAFF
ncbi:hypothetical protein [Gynuella sp.]|uniref:hypothetical protein n=1 Tax=Gynuella sp. TaxID=2969146 RepID=UPI003D0DEBD7